jgi:hypothetical protein
MLKMKRKKELIIIFSNSLKPRYNTLYPLKLLEIFYLLGITSFFFDFLKSFFITSFTSISSFL